ncbi:MAG: M56 family metallopeptidase, partial [Bacteroidota bacterium]
MTGQANFLQSLGWAVFNSLWQLALLWVVYQILTAAFKSARPAAKSLLASSLLMLGFAWFVFTFFITYSTGNTSQIIIAPGLVNENPGIGTDNWLQRILPAASVIYLALLIIPLLHFVKNYRYVQVIRKYGLSKSAPEWRIFVNNIAVRMGIRKPVHIWISEWVTSPVTIGFLKPVILVPMAAINHLNPQQMEAVLLHELSHIRRHDYLLNFILNIIKTILYFNPFAKAFVKIVETEREKSCD